ncbi:DnaB-like helicase C-terminal domain-containing protein [Lederbergia lenta]|uniref:DnaB-like helicase C-terminal domain-containing protein n=1 Tax=Lederbergia lenta TaxID=1467 RepID=UPI00203B3402|nr:DnaB-like helicase C-terminal domain-containing protein [Lederbergia lenta]MCM3109904.1 DNA helicase [Lederbergia lenta]
MKLIEEYPESLVNDRNTIEASFIFCLWKNPESYSDYMKEIKSDSDLLTKDGKFYYTIGYKMYEQGYRSFDDASIYSYIGNNELLAEEYKKRGGYKSVDEMKRILNEANIERYYDELVKSNAILQLHDEGYDVLQYIDKFKKMNYSQLEDFVEYKLNNIFFKSSLSGVNVVDLATGYDKWIDQWDTGVGVGFRVGFPLINYHLAGIHRKNLILHLAGIGQGKSTSALLFYVLPTIEQGESVCIMANEQDEEQFRQMMIATVLFNRINYRKMNRQKILFGNFNDDDKQALRDSAVWLEKYKNQLHYVHLNDYDLSNIKRIIKKYSKLGVGLFLLDTMKPQDDSSDKSWAEFSEVSKEIFLLAQKEDVAVIATAQLASTASSRKFLDLSCIGKSRAIAETAGQVLMFRPLREIEKEKLFVYKFAKDVNGKYTNIKKQVVMDKDKDYIVLFVPKNRYGKAGDLQIVYERNMDFNTMKELGYCHIEYDGFGK